MSFQARIVLRLCLFVGLLIIITVQSGCPSRLTTDTVKCSKYQIKINGVCKDPPCKRGYFLKDGLCHRCHYSCRSCVTYNVCDSCSGGRSLHGGYCFWKCPRKHRTILSDSSPGIKICAKRKQEENTCKLGEWEQWTECGTVGGPNIRTRTRKVGDGLACTGIAPIEHRHCLSLGFDADLTGCIVSDWLPWEQCDTSCRNKFRRRRRIAETVPDGMRKKRALCPNLVEEEPCPCYTQNLGTIDGMTQCEMNDWTPWSQCDAPCGQGVQKRIKSPRGPQNTLGCKTYTETRPCCLQSCQEYCSGTLLGEWTGWGKCDGSCEHSTRRRVRTNLFPSVLMFCDLHQLYQEMTCKKRGCKDQCVLSSWGEWEACDNGSKSRHRQMISGNRCPSPELVDSVPCS